ncbi:hypothetical protein LPJ71_003410, partial [Coemansia sp. S17]
ASSVSATPVASSGSLSRKASVATGLSQASDVTEQTPLLAGGSSASIAVNDMAAESGLVRFTLRDISLRFPVGGLSIGLELNPAAGQGEDSVSSANVNDMRSEDDYASGVVTGALVDDEEREQGYVRLSVWLDYMRMCGPPWYWVTVIGLMFINRTTSIIQDYCVRLWMSASDDTSAPHTVVFWLTAYLLTGLLSTAVNLADWVNEGVGALRAGRRLDTIDAGA